MYITLTEHDFLELTMKFSEHKDNFSYEGKKALFQYLQEYEESTDNQIEFDYIDLCCQYSEYETEQDLLQEYQSSSLDNLRDNTEIIEFRKYDFDNFASDFGILPDREYKSYKSYIIRDF